MLQSYFEPEFCSRGFLKYDAIYEYADKLIGKFDIRSEMCIRDSLIPVQRKDSVCPER